MILADTDAEYGEILCTKDETLQDIIDREFRNSMEHNKYELISTIWGRYKVFAGEKYEVCISMSKFDKEFHMIRFNETLVPFSKGNFDNSCPI